MTQHKRLDAERWGRFTLDQQILMIANEMNRARGLLGPGDLDPLRRSYERVLRLVDLTAGAASRPALRRELLRWRGLVAEQYVAARSDEVAHRAAFRALLHFTPAAAKQIPHLLGS